jgi:hypothetical protein
MKKVIVGLFAAVMLAGTVLAQLPVVSVESISRQGTPDTVAAAYLRVYNTGGTAAVSYVTFESSDTNVFTVSTNAVTISNNVYLVTLTFATDLDVGNYSESLVVTQTNSPATIVTVPVSLRITRDTSQALGSLADIRIVNDNLGDTPALAPRKFGDVLIAKYTVTDTSGTDTEYMNMWVSSGTTTDDWESVGGQVFTAITLAAPRRDTNTATTITGYTPRYYGDMLIGRTDAATGAVWVAVGATTNDWKVIGP